MFALEGCVLNAGLLASAYRFHKKRSVDNARTVFRATLVYLPLMLFFFVLHSTRLKDTSGSEDDRTLPTLGDAVRPLRDLGRALCLHELFADEPAAEPPALCPAAPATDRARETTTKQCPFSSPSNDSPR